ELSAIDADEPATAKLAVRTGELFAQHDDADAALRWYRRAFAFEPESRDLFDRIDRLLAKEGRHDERAQHHRAVVDDRDGEERVATLLVIADLERKELGRKEDAVET